MLDTFKQVDVPEGISGAWAVERFSVEANDIAIHNIREPARRMKPGTFTRLTNHGSVVMSDTQAELYDLYPLYGHMSGRMLFNGLGLGVAAQAALEQDAVCHVTVVEKSRDVIRLVGEHYYQRYGDRLEIHCADAFLWQPPKGIKYDAVWHDIWPAICGDYWSEIKRLHRRYGKRCRWQGSWCREEIMNSDKRW